MNRWHNNYLDNHAHFCTATVADWRPLLDNDSIPFLYQEWESARLDLDVKILAYVVMPEHFHIINWSKSGDMICRFLQRTLAQTSRVLAPKGERFWKERPRVVPVYSGDILQTKIDYIHRNPMRRGLVENPEEWPYSSFRQIVLGEQGEGLVCDGWEDIMVR